MKLKTMILAMSFLSLAACGLDGRETPPSQSNVPSTPADTPKESTPVPADASAETQSQTETEAEVPAPVPAETETPREVLTKTQDRVGVTISEKDEPQKEVAPKVETPVIEVTPVAPQIVKSYNSLFERFVAEDDVTQVRNRIERGLVAGLDSIDVEGRVPMHYARSAEMVTLLQDRPVVVGREGFGRGGTGTRPVYKPQKDIADKNGQFPLHTIAASGSDKAVRAIVDQECGYFSPGTLDRQDNNGQTALHIATISKQLGSLVELMRCGGNMTLIVDNQKRTAAHYAAESSGFVHGLLLLFRHSEAKALRLKDINGEKAPAIADRVQDPETYAILHSLFY